MAAHLLAQAEAGAQALQIFDSWVGALHPAAYRRSVAPHVGALFDRLEPLGVPLIHFGVGHRRAARATWPRPAAT